MSYEEARALAQAHGIQSRPQWADFVKTRSPRDVPSAPAVVYKDHWTSWGEFLGTGRIADREKSANFLTYEEAKQYLRSFGFKNEAEFYAWASTPECPTFIPARPRKAYGRLRGFGGWKESPPTLEVG